MVLSLPITNTHFALALLGCIGKALRPGADSYAFLNLRAPSPSPCFRPASSCSTHRRCCPVKLEVSRVSVTRGFLQLVYPHSHRGTPTSFVQLVPVRSLNPRVPAKRAALSLLFECKYDDEMRTPQPRMRFIPAGVPEMIYFQLVTFGGVRKDGVSAEKGTWNGDARRSRSVVKQTG